MKTTFAALLTAAAVAIGASSPALSAGAPIPPAQPWGFSGMFGTFERDDLRRGLQVYREVCSNCHSLNRIAFRNLADLGLSPEQVTEIAGSYEVQDGPDDTGDMFMRAAIAADFFPAPFANEQAARYANGGAYPPDLSLITKATAGESVFKGTKFRETGADYVVAVLTGYKDEPPEGVELMEGKYYNVYFRGGNQIGMAPPLMDGSVEYADGTPATQQQHARDVATFLAWAADPNAEERKNLGVKVILFLFALTLMLYAVKRKIWADVHH